MRRLALLGVLLLAGASATIALTGFGSAATPRPKLTAQQRAQFLLDHRSATLSSSALVGLKLLTRTHDVGGDAPLTDLGPAARAAAAPAAQPVQPAGVPNVRVNNPATDTRLDQTTQSETSIAVSGSNVAVGYNDSSLALPVETAGLNLTGYSYSRDGGKTFTDGGGLPQGAGMLNLGDPWLGATRNGTMLFGELAIDEINGPFQVAVARSTDGGKTWSAPTAISPGSPDMFYLGDKDALTVGRDPVVAARDDAYVAWDDFSCDFNSGTCADGLPVSHSTDGGQTWQLVYADQNVENPDQPCNFTAYLGAQPLVDPASGTLYIAAERFSITDTTPDCSGNATFQTQQVVFRSTDGGQTFGPAVVIADITSSFAIGALQLGPGQFARNAEFPTVAIRNGNVYVAWNDGGNGPSNVRLAKSTDHGSHWSLRWATSGVGDDFQPALTADGAGLHLAYYHHEPGASTFNVYAADSSNGSEWSTRVLTTAASPGVQTVPQFDPTIAWAYMGDYIASVTDGSHRYYAWGDNRDRVTNDLWPKGRNDPDVFFASR
jgi:hypothetical protein